MLEKTLSLLANIPPGTYVSPEQPVFDQVEIDQLGDALSRLLYAPSNLRKRLQEFNVTIVPSDFYSQIPTVEELESSFSVGGLNDFDEIFDGTAILEELTLLNSYSSEFDPPVEDDGSGYFWGNSQFSYSDAMAYYCMIRSRKPQKIIEIGSGFSTQVASKAVAANGFGEIVCIEPFPRDFLPQVPHVSLIIQKKIQEISPLDFCSLINDGDILFIDSTHTVKHNSDCVHIYLKLLPIIKSNILVHAHDIFLPRSFGLEEMRDHQIHWTEQYLLYAYLMDNVRTSVRFSSSFLHMRHKAVLDAFMHGRRPSGGGSIWFEQRARA